MIKCNYYDNGFCKAASFFTEIKVPTYDKSCQACLSGAKDVPRGLAIIELHKQGKKLNSNNKTISINGPGTELSKLVSWFKFTNKECRCSERINKMNLWGPDECERRRPTIRRWLRHSAYLNGVPFNTKVVDVLIDKAIKNARSKMGSGGSDGT